MTRATLLLGLGLVLLLAACSGGSYDGLRFDVDRGTASEIELLTLDEMDAMRGGVDVDLFASDVRLDRCRLVFPGTTIYDLTVDEETGFDYPLDLLVVPVEIAGDVGLPGASQRVTVSGPGTFSVVSSRADTFAGYEAEVPLVHLWGPRSLDLSLFEEDERRAREEEGEEDGGFPCDVTVLALDGTNRGRDTDAEIVEFELDPQQPLGDPPRGTIQGLAEEADWTDAADPWATLAWAHGSGGGLFAEEVLLGGDGWVLEGIFERFEGGCYAVHTSYLSIEGDDFANVAQAQGECPEQQAADVPERRGWYVSVDATDPRFEDGLEWYRNALPRDPAVLDELGPAGF